MSREGCAVCSAAGVPPGCCPDPRVCVGTAPWGQLVARGSVTSLPTRDTPWFCDFSSITGAKGLRQMSAFA